MNEPTEHYVVRLDQDDNLWIAEDSRRQGCWASAPTRDDALVALGRAQVDYDDTFGVSS